MFALFMDKEVLKNYLYSLSYQILLIIAPIVTAPYVSRVLYADGIGVFSYTYTIATAFSLFAALGVNSYGQREIAYCGADVVRRSVVFYEIMIIRLTMTLVVTVAYVVFSLMYSEFTTYLLAEVFVVISVLPDTAWFFRGVEDFRLIAIRNVIVKLCTIAAIFIFVRNENDVLTYVALNALSAFLGNLLYVPYLKKYLVRVSLRELNPKNHIRGTIEFFVPLLAVELYSHLDRIMLGAIAGSAIENGYYEQSRKIVSLVLTVVVSLNTVLYSRVSHLYANSEDESIINSYRMSFRVILMLVIPIAAGLFVISDNFVMWFFGDGFEGVSVLIKASCPMLAFMCVGNFVGMQYLSPTGQQNKMTAAYLVSAALNVLLNVMLIPHWAALGALIASIAAEACSCAIQVYLLKKSEYNFKMLTGVWRYIVAAAVMTSTLLALQFFGGLTGPIETLLEILIGVLVYSAAVFVVRDPIAVLCAKLMKRAVRPDEKA